MAARRNWTSVGIGLEVLAGVIVAIDPLLAIPVALGGLAAIVWGLCPDQVRRGAARLGIKIKHKTEQESNFAVGQASPTWNKVEMGTIHMGQNEEEILETVAINQDPFDVDFRWWPKDKVFCEYTGSNRVRCKRASDTARHENVEIRYEIWVNQNGTR